MKILYITKYFMSRIQFGGRRTCAVPESAACVRPRGQEQVKTRGADAIGPFRATSNSPKSVTASVSGVSREESLTETRNVLCVLGFLEPQRITRSHELALPLYAAIRG